MSKLDERFPDLQRPFVARSRVALAARMSVILEPNEETQA
jgi:hypothetical protein